MTRRAWVLLTVPLLAACGSDQPEPSPATPETVQTTTDAPTESEHVTEAAAPVMVAGGVHAPRFSNLQSVTTGQDCVGYEDYEEIEKGVQVLIEGAASNIVGVAQLGDAQFIEPAKECVWEFSAEVPAGEGFYSARIEGFGVSQVVSEDDEWRLYDLWIEPE